METKWYGIYIVKDEDGFFLYSDNGDEQFFDHLPTIDEQKTFRNVCISATN